MKNTGIRPPLAAILIYALIACVNAGSSKSSKSCKSSKSSKRSKYDCTPGPTPFPTPAPTPVPTLPPTLAPTAVPSSQPTLEDVLLSFTDEKINYVNVAEVPYDDIEALFSIQKDWYEDWYRENTRRRLDRRRESRDITTTFEFVSQNVTSDDGTNTNEVNYNQFISFLPPSRRRRLVEFDVDDMDEVLAVTTMIYRDEDALDNLAATLRENVESFSEVTSIFKFKPKSKSSKSSKSSKRSKSSKSSKSSRGKGRNKNSRGRRMLTKT